MPTQSAVSIRSPGMQVPIVCYDSVVMTSANDAMDTQALVDEFLNESWAQGVAEFSQAFTLGDKLPPLDCALQSRAPKRYKNSPNCPL